MLSKKFTSYTIKTIPLGLEVERRYSDIDWLRTVFVRDHPGIFVESGDDSDPSNRIKVQGKQQP